jgi:hypothetical protein
VIFTLFKKKVSQVGPLQGPKAEQPTQPAGKEISTFLGLWLMNGKHMEHNGRRAARAGGEWRRTQLLTDLDGKLVVMLGSSVKRSSSRPLKGWALSLSLDRTVRLAVPPFLSLLVDPVAAAIAGCAVAATLVEDFILSVGFRGGTVLLGCVLYSSLLLCLGTCVVPCTLSGLCPPWHGVWAPCCAVFFLSS